MGDHLQTEAVVILLFSIFLKFYYTISIIQFLLDGGLLQDKVLRAVFKNFGPEAVVEELMC